MSYVSVSKLLKSIEQPYGGFVPKCKFTERQVHPPCPIDIDSRTARVFGTMVDQIVKYLLDPEQNLFYLFLKEQHAYELAVEYSAHVWHMSSQEYEGQMTMTFAHCTHSIELHDWKDVIWAFKGIASCNEFERFGKKTGSFIMDTEVSEELKEAVIYCVENTIEYLQTLRTQYSNVFKNVRVTHELDDGKIVGISDIVIGNNAVELKCTSDGFDKNMSLQIALYYLLGCEQNKIFKYVNTLVIYNPRLGLEYAADVLDIQREFQHIKDTLNLN